MLQLELSNKIFPEKSFSITEIVRYIVISMITISSPALQKQFLLIFQLILSQRWTALNEKK